MGTNLYVGNVSYNTTEDDIQTLFSQVGSVVRCSLVMDKMTGRSRGFAFVEMGSQDDATKAVNELNGRELDGRALVVNEARPREERPRGGGGGGWGGGGDRGGGWGGGGGGDRGGRGGGGDRQRREWR